MDILKEIDQVLEEVNLVNRILPEDINVPRIPRIVLNRTHLFETLNEREFIDRFRLSKSSVLIVLQKIEAALEYTSNR